MLTQTDDRRYQSNEKDRFFSKVSKTDSCWLWVGGCFSDGYGQFWTKFKNYRSHRYSWELHFGEITDGLHVLHKCDNPKCVNPEHLFLGTEKDNAADRDTKGRHAVSRGYVQSPETRLKRSLTMKGSKGRLGVPHTKETRLKMSLASSKRNKDAKGRFLSNAD